MTESYERNSTIIGFFRHSEDAFGAVSKLRTAGFKPEEINVAIRGGGSGERYTYSGADTDEHKGGLWKNVRSLFSRNAEENHANAEDFRQSMGGLDIDDERANYYYRGILRGGALVTVQLSVREAEAEARAILRDAGADLRERGFGAGSAGAREGKDRKAA